MTIGLLCVALSATVKADVVTFWNFDNGNYKDSVQQISLNPQNATISDNKFVTSTSYGGYARATVNNLPTRTSSYTLSAFLETNSAAANGIMGWGSSNNNRCNCFRTNDKGNGLVNYWWSNDASTDAAYPIISTGLSNHVVATLNSTTRSIYLNGQLLYNDTVSAVRSDATTNLLVGSTVGNERLKGSLDNVSIYNDAMSHTDIINIASSRYSGLTNWWKNNDTYDRVSGYSKESASTPVTAIEGDTGTMYFNRELTNREKAYFTGQLSNEHTYVEDDISASNAQSTLWLKNTDCNLSDLSEKPLGIYVGGTTDSANLTASATELQQINRTLVMGGGTLTLTDQGGVSFSKSMAVMDGGNLDYQGTSLLMVEADTLTSIGSLHSNGSSLYLSTGENKNLVISSKIELANNSGVITKQGAGNLYITATANNRTNGTAQWYITGGTVYVGGENSNQVGVMGTGSINIQNGAKLVCTQANAFSYGDNPNTLNITNSTFQPHTYTHVKNISLNNSTIDTEYGYLDAGSGIDFGSRTATLTSRGSSYIKSRVNFSTSNTTINVQDGTLTFSGKLSGGKNTVIKNGNGTMVLTSNASLAGIKLTITQGKLVLNSVHANADTLIRSNVTNGVELNGYLSVDNSGYVAAAGTWAGNGNIYVQNGGTLRIAGTFTYDQGITLRGGMLFNDGDNGGTNATYNGPITVQDNSYLKCGWSGTLTLNSTLTGSGNLTVQKDSGTIIFNTVAEGYSGNIRADGYGNIQLGRDNAFGDSVGSACINGQIDMNGFSQVFKGLSNDYNDWGTICNHSSSNTLSTLTINTPAGTSFTYGGGIYDAIELVKEGLGTETLTKSNSNYTGNVTINEGKLVIGCGFKQSENASALGKLQDGRTVTVNQNGELVLAAQDVYSNSTTSSPIQIILNGGKMYNEGTVYNNLNNLVFKNGAELTATNGNGEWKAYKISGKTSVLRTGESTEPSRISSTDVNNANATISFGNGGVLYVENVTESSESDFIVSAIVTNPNQESRTSITKTGNGTVEFIGTSSRPSFYTNVTVNEGSMKISGYTLDGTQLIVNNNSQLILGGDNTRDIYSKADALIKANSGTVQLNNNLILDGNTAVAGRWVADNGSKIIVPSGKTLSIGGTLTLDSAIVLDGGMLFNNGNQGGRNAVYNGRLDVQRDSTVQAGWSGTLTINGTLTGTGSITANADGGWTIFNTQAEGFTGNIITKTNGFIQLGRVNAFGDSVGIADISGKLNLYGYSQSFKGLTSTYGTGGSICNWTTRAATPADLTLNIDAGRTYTYRGVINDTTNLVKNGDGTQILTNSGSNFTGNVTINEGVLKIAGSFNGKTSALGTVQAGRRIAINNDGTLVLAADNVYSNSATYSQMQIIVNGGTLYNEGAVYNNLNNVVFENGAKLVATNGNRTWKAYTLSGKTAILATGESANAVEFSSNLSNPNATISFGNASQLYVEDVTSPAGASDNLSDLIISAVIANRNDGNTNIIKTGNGIAEFTAANTYTGTTTISAGTIRLTGNGTLGTGAIINNSALEFYSTTSKALNNNISGSGTLTFSGDGTSNSSFDLRNCVSSGFTGKLTIDKARVIVMETRDYGNTSTNIDIQSGGQLYIPSGTVQGNFTIAGNGTSEGSGSLGAIRVENGYINGTIKLSDDAKIANNFGRSTINASVDLAGHTLTLGGTGQLNPSGVISDSSLEQTGSVIYDSTAHFDIKGANTYSGTTTLKNGTLYAYNDISYGTSKVILEGGTFSQVGRHSFNNDIEIKGTTTINTNGNNSMILNGILSGSGAVTKVGNGTLQIQGVNTFTGTTTISVGSILLSGNGTLGTGTVINNSKLELNYNADADVVVSNQISGTGSIIKSGTGSADIQGANTYTGTTKISAGTIRLSGNGTLGTGAIAIENGGTLELALDSDNSFSNVISGEGKLLKSGANTIEINVANTLTGTTSIADGTVKLTGNGTLGTSNVVNDSTLELAYDSENTFSNTISGTGELVKSGAEVQVLDNNANTFTGNVSVNEGTLKVTTSGNQTDKTSALGALQADRTVTVNNGAELILAASDVTTTKDTTEAGVQLIANGGKISNEGAVYNNLNNTVFQNGAELVANNGDETNGAYKLSSKVSVTRTGNEGANAVKFSANSENENATYSVANNTEFYVEDITTTIPTGKTKYTVDNKADLIIAAGIIDPCNETVTAINKTGTGTLEFTSSNTYGNSLDSMTNIVAGAIRLSGEGTLGDGTIDISKGASLEFNVDENVTRYFENKITGSGDITKTGLGTLKYNATVNKITGKTFTVEAGTLELKGKFSGKLKVKKGATLAPGNSVGTLEVDELILENGAILLMEMSSTNPEENDQLIIKNSTESALEGNIYLTLSEDSTLGPNDPINLNIVLEDLQDAPVEPEQEEGETDEEFKKRYEEYVEESTEYVENVVNISNAISDSLSSYYFRNLEVGDFDPDTKTFVVNGEVDPNAVPEPSTWALLILSLAGLVWLRKRK